MLKVTVSNNEVVLHIHKLRYYYTLVEEINYPPIELISDHSVHTTRLWAMSETKKIANSWNMAAFFKITHDDIQHCLSQLNMLKLTDYTAEIEKGGLEVHVEVCAKMRAKLVSEVKENIEKLKVRN